MDEINCEHLRLNLISLKFTYQFSETLLWDHGLNLTHAVTKGKFGGYDEFWLGFAICGFFILLPWCLLLLCIKDLVIDNLENIALIFLEFLNWCFRNLEDTIFRKNGWLWSSIFAKIICRYWCGNWIGAEILRGCGHHISWSLNVVGIDVLKKRKINLTS